MGYLRTDILSLFDIDFLGDSIAQRDISVLESHTESTHALRRYKSSFSWLFYGNEWPGFRTYSLPTPEDMKNCRGTIMRVNPKKGIGVYAVWQTHEGPANPLSVKRGAWDTAKRATKLLNNLGLSIAEIERHYPFVATRVDASDVNEYVVSNSIEIGRVFTGDYESESDEQLAGYVDGNISRRGYEKLYIRWTEALAVYGKDINEEKYENSLCRVVQIFELCVLMRRLLRNMTLKMDKLSSSVSLFAPKPWSVNRLLHDLSDMQKTFVLLPPIKSVEAERLLNDAFREFGITQMLDSTRQSAEFLERRFQWAKTQLLVAIAVATYILDKVLELFKA